MDLKQRILQLAEEERQRQTQRRESMSPSPNAAVRRGGVLDKDGNGVADHTEYERSHLQIGQLDGNGDGTADLTRRSVRRPWLANDELERMRHLRPEQN